MFILRLNVKLRIAALARELDCARETRLSVDTGPGALGATESGKKDENKG